jgi:hypothetical protein
VLAAAELLWKAYGQLDSDEFDELDPDVVEEHEDFYLWNEVVYLFVPTDQKNPPKIE